MDWKPIILAFYFIVPPTSGESSKGIVDELVNLINSWDTSNARSILEMMAEKRPDETWVLYMLGKVDYLDGEYSRSIFWFEEALAESQKKGGSKIFKKSDIEWMLQHASYMASLIQNSVSYETQNSIITFMDIRDDIMASYIADVFETIYERIGNYFGFFPEKHVRIEVYPDVQTLSQASTLPADNILTTATVAICKFNRIMILSPRVMLRGYHWADTLAHEYVHYIVTRLSAGNAPLWLQEAVAKYIQSVWKGRVAEAITKNQLGLLKNAIDEGKLISLEEMEPSLAKLPSQKATQLAFTQLYMAAKYLIRAAGDGAINRLLESLGKGYSTGEALKAAIGMSFNDFKDGWHKFMKLETKRLKPLEEIEEFLIFRDKELQRFQTSDLQKEERMKFFTLAEMLRSRGNCRAAIAEYEKGFLVSKQPSLYILNNAAMCYLSLGHTERAEELLARIKDKAPNSILLWKGLGKMFSIRSRIDDAIDAYFKCCHINPFDPEIHLQLYRLLMLKGEEEEAINELNIYRRLIKSIQQD